MSSGQLNTDLELRRKIRSGFELNNHTDKSMGVMPQGTIFNNDISDRLYVEERDRKLSPFFLFLYHIYHIQTRQDH